MSNDKLRFPFLLAALLCAGILLLLVLRPFLYALALAAVGAAVLQPVHRRMLRLVRGSPAWSAFATLLAVFIFLFIPAAFIGAQLLDEARKLYVSLNEKDGAAVMLDAARTMLDGIAAYVPGARDLSVNVNDYLKQGLDWMLGNIGSVFAALMKTALNAFVFFFALYYFLKDGPRLKAAIVAASPLPAADTEEISKKLGVAVDSIVRSNLIIALTQGTLASVGLFIFGVPHAVLWGSIAAVAALVPGIGTALVLTPAIAFLLLTGEPLSALGLLAWGMTAVGLVDNVLGPKLIARGAALHPTVILLSVLGGIVFFGPVGFLFGPLAASLFFALLDIYLHLMKEKRS